MKLLFSCFLGLFAATAMAYVSDPELDPNPALAGQNVNVLIETGHCDEILGGEENRTITVIDETIDVIVEGIRSTSPFCLAPVWNNVIPIGAYSPGYYVVTARYRYTDPLTGEPVIEELGDLPLTVLSQVVPQPVPALGVFGMLLLTLIVLLFGGLMCSRKVF